MEKSLPFYGFLGTPLGISMGEAKKVMESERKKLFLDRTERSPYALYASGTYLAG